MRPFSSSSPVFSYGRQQQQRVWLDGGGGDGEGGEVMMMMDSSRAAAAADVNVNGGGDEAAGTSSGVLIEKEHMFDKVVTPSDVGKLNRLVIPKQHAEKYFPLDSSNNEKGLLLNFEDRNGKPWRFRYSYWNSSQSYVMTKGWSRFVKEKKLDAGDVVSFQRGAAESVKDRLFIDWRRRPDSHHHSDHHHHHHLHRHPHLASIPAISLPGHHLSFHRYPAVAPPWNHHQPVLSPTPPPPYGFNSVIFNAGASGGAVVVNGNPCSGSPGGPSSSSSLSSSGIYLRPIIQMNHQEEMMQRRGGGGGGSGEGGGEMVFSSVPVVQGKAAAKRLRLFGVNMDCPISDSDDCDILSSSAASASTTTIPTTSLHLRPCSAGGYHPQPELLFQPDDNKTNKSTSTMSLDLDI